MPRTAINYSKAVVYRIVYKDITYYIGSTTNFTRRKSQHKIGCSNNKKKEYNKPLYEFIRENGGWSDEWVMVMVEEYPNCKSSLELLRYERIHYDFYKPEYNMVKPIRIEGENESYHKNYQVVNADKIRVNKKEYFNENIDTIKEYQKEYRVVNGDKIKEQQKEYCLLNVLKIREYHNEKHNCECGGKYTNGHLSRHKKSKIHIKYEDNMCVISIGDVVNTV